MVDTLLEARKHIERRLLKAATDKRFATVRRIREGIYKDIQAEYVALNGDLAKWTDESILATSKEYHALAAKDLLLTDDDKSVISFTKFSKKHTDDYFARISPFTAAENVAINAHLGSMASTDIRAMQTAFTEAFREAQVAGMTSAERWTLMQSKLLKYADDPDTWQFIDRAGRKWKRGNYFNMVNRTVSAQVSRDAYNDTLTDEGRDLVQIIGPLSSNSHDACIKWVGRVVSLTGNTSGFPTLQDYVDDGGFHPNCVHSTVYISDKVEKTAQIIDEQRGTPAPNVPQSRAKPVIKMKNADKPA
jgi:hypothetical protein